MTIAEIPKSSWGMNIKDWSSLSLLSFLNVPRFYYYYYFLITNILDEPIYAVKRRENGTPKHRVRKKARKRKINFLEHK